MISLARIFAYLLPECLDFLVVGMVRALLIFVAKKEQAQFRDNVTRILKLSPRTYFYRDFFKQCLRHQVENALDTLRIVVAQKPIELSGFEDFKKAVLALGPEGKTPIIFCTAHLGSWEMAAKFSAAASGQTLHVLARQPRFKPLQEFLLWFRDQLKTKILWNDRSDLLRRMLEILKSGGTLGFVMDQKPERRQGIECSFFGLPTTFVSGPAAVALKRNAAVVMVFCLREGRRRYRLLFRVLTPAAKDNFDEDERALTQACAGEIERAIRLYPEQWTWNYRRWVARA